VRRLCAQRKKLATWEEILTWYWFVSYPKASLSKSGNEKNAVATVMAAVKAEKRVGGTRRM
jgi:hypothetical protein